VRFAELICDTPIETVFIGKVRLQLVPMSAPSRWRVFRWPALLGELTHEKSSWKLFRDGKLFTEDAERRIVLTVLVIGTSSD
jgi:hypothetical protein